MNIKSSFLDYSRVLYSWIRHKGGTAQSYKTAWALFRREGWRGIKRKIISLNAEISMVVLGGIDQNNYDYWILQYDTLGEEECATLLERCQQFEHKPLISIVMPTYNPNPEWLAEAIESVQDQIYPHWELCIADDCSTDTAIHELLETYASKDSRIKLIFRTENGHISAASNSALSLAGGEWVALLDHDDLLSRHALYWVCAAINEDRNIRLIYSDEDKVDEQGSRFNPYFKCSWNQDLFYAQNMFSHLGVYRKDLVEFVGGFRLGLEGAQDYDLALRCIEKIELDQIHHIPVVLYHWRVHPESTALSGGNAKPYAMLAGERAINDHFHRCDIDASAELTGYGYRVRYALPKNPPLVSIIIPTRNSHRLISRCIESILSKTDYPAFEILVVDNGSDDKRSLRYFEKISQNPRIRVIRDNREFNYSSLNNGAVEAAAGELVCLLNNDTEIITPGWLTEMVSHALRPGVGAVGAKLYYSDGTIQHIGLVMGLHGVVGHLHCKEPGGTNGYFSRAALTSSFSAITAACLVVKKSVYQQVNGLNEKDLKIAYNDVDFCLRLVDAGYKNIFTPYAELFHYESKTRGYENTPEKLVRFKSEVAYMESKWGKYIGFDPAYSPNLTHENSHCALAWPPRFETPYLKGAARARVASTKSENSLAIVIHVFYMDVFEDILSRIEGLKLDKTLYVTTTFPLDDEVYCRLQETDLDYHLLPVENLGRDVFPFLKLLPKILAHGHVYLLKLHTKKSIKRQDGGAWAEDLLNKLVSDVDPVKILNFLQKNPDVGMVGPSGHLVPCAKYWGANRNRTLWLAKEIGLSKRQVALQSFVAGTMFYARVSALKPIIDLALSATDFEQEAGQTDGTMAHAVERLLSLAIVASGQKMVDTDLAASTKNEQYRSTDA